MRFDVSPYQITLGGMEIYCEETVDLHPGDVLRFDVEGGSGKPVYGVVADVRAQAKALDNEMLQAVTVDVLYGTPAFNMGVAERLREDQMGEALLSLQKDIQHPLVLTEHFTGEFLNLDTLTLIEGPSFGEKYEALLMLMNAIQPYQRLVVIDPIGVFSPADGVTVLSAAHDVRLSLADVGMKRVLAGVAEALPEPLQASAIQYLAGFLADAHDFMAFDTLLNRVRMDGTHPSALAVLENLERQGVFANERSQALSLQALQQAAVIALDVSSLPEPWKTLFYEEAIGTLLSDAGGDVVPVLIYPENYLKQLPQLVRKADEADLTMLVLASPYLTAEIEAMADNRLIADRDNRLYVSGSLTYGLPVTLTMTGEAAAMLVEDAPASEEIGYDDLPGSDFEGLTFGVEETAVPLADETPDLLDALPPELPIDVTSDEPLTISASDELWQPPPIIETESDEPLPVMSPEELGEGAAQSHAVELPIPESRSVHTMFDDDEAWQVPDESETARLGDFDSILGTADEVPKTDYDILPPPGTQEDWAAAASKEEGEFDSILGGHDDMSSADVPDMPPLDEMPCYEAPGYEMPTLAPPETQELPPLPETPAPDWQADPPAEDFEFDLSLAEGVGEDTVLPEPEPDMPVMLSPEAPTLPPLPPLELAQQELPAPDAPAPLNTLFEEGQTLPPLPPPPPISESIPVDLPADMPLPPPVSETAALPPPLPAPDAGLPADTTSGLPADMPLPPPLPPPSILEQRVETDPSLWEPPGYYQPPSPPGGLPADMPLPPPLPAPDAGLPADTTLGLPADMPLPPPLPPLETASGIPSDTAALPPPLPAPDSGLPADMPLPPPLPPEEPAEDSDDFNFPDETALMPAPLRVEPDLTPLGAPDSAGSAGPPPDSEGIPVVQRAPETEEVVTAEKPGFKPGDQVRHDEYGVGIINKVIPMEGSVVLNITFEHVGKRLMDPALSELQKI